MSETEKPSAGAMRAAKRILSVVLGRADRELVPHYEQYAASGIDAEVAPLVFALQNIRQNIKGDSRLNKLTKDTCVAIIDGALADWEGQCSNES